MVLLYKSKIVLGILFIIIMMSFLCGCGDDKKVSDAKASTSSVVEKKELKFAIEDQALWDECQKLYEEQKWKEIKDKTYSYKDKVYSSELGVMYYLAETERRTALNYGDSYDWVNKIPSSYNGVYADRVKDLRKITKKLFDKVANEVEADLKSSGELILNIGDLESRVKEVYGEPEAINQTETSNGIRRQYVFTSKKTGKQVYVYTKNNKVVAIQN